MKNFNELTRLGRIRRCKKIVEEGLPNYDFKVASLKFLCEETNIFYTLKDDKGNKYAVKIYQELSSDINDAKAELFFLKHIYDKTNICVPKPIANKDGDYVTLINSKYDTVKKRMAVYEWMDGKDFDENEKVEHFYEVGKIMANLHDEARKLGVPEQLKVKKLDKVLYYAGDDYFYKMDKHKDKIDEKYVNIMDFVIPYLDDRLSKLYEQDTFLIHADFNPFNIRLYKNKVRLLDFEDVSLGHEVHDIAILFFYYFYDDDFEAYKREFYRGYKEVRDLDINEDDIELLMTARRVNFLNYILEISDEPQKYIERNLKRVEDYLDKVFPSYINHI